MTETDELQAFAREIQQQVIARADADDGERLRPEVFTDLMFEFLVAAAEIDDGTSCSFEARGVRCSGYYLSEDSDRLDLFLSIPVLDGNASNIPKTDIHTAFKRLAAFLRKALEGMHREREEALDAFDMARSVWLARNDLSHVRLFVLTDGLATIDKIDDDAIGGIAVSHHLWDLRRTLRAMSSGVSRERVSVDFVALMGKPLRGVVSTPVGSGYRCILTIFPGELIVKMYQQFGPRLLERNVRSFLQLKGKVNQSIRRTIMEEPQMFLAFNNGLSVTASGLNLVSHDDGTAELVSADDFQIVNGGQTTGSIFRAARKDDADIQRLQVPVKVTEILSDGDVEEIAPRISQSANTQNKVNMADFSSNHPFHRQMQELSRSIWAPPAHGMQRQSRWFYERSRGQYQDALAQNRTPAERKAWESLHPRRQVITKTELAKFEHTWSQLPHIVSRGGQKCYLDFMDLLDRRGAFVPDEQYFHRAMARALLFRETERIVSRQKFGGYRANIVTYSLASISYHTAKRIDLDAIWRTQALSPALAQFIEVVSAFAYEWVSAPPGGQNVTEWCKKEVCWDGFRDRGLTIPASLKAELITRDAAPGRPSTHALDDQLSKEEAEQIERLSTVDATTWFNMAAWAKDTQSLQPWQRSLAFSLGKLARAGQTPSRKQAAQGSKILDEARSLGFRG